MSTDCRRRLNKDLYLLIPEHPMNPKQFERWKSQLSQLSPQQLRACKGKSIVRCIKMRVRCSPKKSAMRLRICFPNLSNSGDTTKL